MAGEKVLLGNGPQCQAMTWLNAARLGSTCTRQHLHPAAASTRSDNAPPDVTVVVTAPEADRDNRAGVFKTRRAVLVSGSEYFATMLTGMWAFDAVAQSTFRLVDMRSETFADVLEYITNGRVRVDEDALLPVLEAAHFLQVTPLVAAAEAAVRKRLCTANCVAAWELAELADLRQLGATAVALALRDCYALLRGLDDELPSAAAAACELIAAACSTGLCRSGARDRLADAGALEVIVRWLRIEFGADLMAAGLRALAAVCAGEGGAAHARRRRAAEAGALEAVAPALCGPVAARGAAAAAVAILCAGTDDGAAARRQAAADAGVLERLALVLDASIASERSRRACEAVAAVCAGADGGAAARRRCAVESGLLDDVLALALQAGGDDADADADADAEAYGSEEERAALELARRALVAGFDRATLAARLEEASASNGASAAGPCRRPPPWTLPAAVACA